jgi:hypothetical protein
VRFGEIAAKEGHEDGDEAAAAVVASTSDKLA